MLPAPFSQDRLVWRCKTSMLVNWLNKSLVLTVNIISSTADAIRKKKK
jgi:hypothetical protein